MHFYYDYTIKGARQETPPDAQNAEQSGTLYGRQPCLQRGEVKRTRQWLNQSPGHVCCYSIEASQIQRLQPRCPVLGVAAKVVDFGTYDGEGTPVLQKRAAGVGERARDRRLLFKFMTL